jgi:outer membrane protein assembly factor BamA
MPRNLILLFASLSLCLGVPAYGQKLQPKTIQFKGDPEYTEKEFLSASNLRLGEVLNYAEMNDHSKLLMDSGMFSSLTFKFDGQDLIFQLTPAENLVPIHIDNIPLSAGPELDAKLHARLPLYHGKVPTEGGLLEQVRTALEAMLVSQGINAAVIASPGADLRTHQVNVVHLAISEPPVLVEVQKISGASDEFQEKLHAVVAVAAKTPFDTENSSSNLERAFAQFYEDRGYAAAKIQARRGGDPQVSAASIVIPYSVAVQEGKLYKIGAVHLPAGAPVAQAAVEKVLSPSPGGPGEGVRLRILWSLIADQYKRKGYLDCKISPEPQFDDASGIVNYNVAVEVGPVYHLAFVKFDNVSDDMRKLLMRNWQMMPGDPFDEGYVANFVIKAQQNDPVLQRSLAGVKTKFDATADPQTHDVNVVIRLEKP